MVRDFLLKNCLQLHLGCFFSFFKCRCNNDAVPHAKWHLQTGIALVDLFHLADMYHEFLSTTATEPGEDPGDDGDGGDPDDGGDDGEGPDDDDDNDEDEEDGSSVQGRNIAMLMVSIVSSVFCSWNL